MVSTSAIVDRYTRYKTGQKKVVNWLTRTAGRFHDLSAYLDCLKTSTSGPLKVKSHELVNLAKMVVAARPAIIPPIEILRTLQEVIDGRREASCFYLSQPAGTTTASKSNVSHVKFIETLDEVKELLSRLHTGSIKATPPSGKKIAKRPIRKNCASFYSGPLVNIFSSLTVEEPNEDPANEALKSPSSAYVRSQECEQDEFQLEDGECNDAFAIWCFLKDMREVRALSRAAWDDFSSGALSLETAGFDTETAIEMLEHLYNDFHAAHPQYNDWTSMMDCLGISSCISGNLFYLYPASRQPATEHPDGDTSMPELLCPGANHMLSLWPTAVNEMLINCIGYQAGTKDFEDLMYCEKPTVPLQSIAYGKVNASALTHFEPIFVELL